MKLEFCFTSRLRPGFHVKSHSHKALEIVYYLEGDGEIAFSDRCWDFSENSFHIAPAGTAHEQRNSTEMNAFCLGVSGSGLEDVSGTWRDHTGMLRYPLELLLSELNAKQDSYEIIAQGLLAQIVGLTRRLISSHPPSGDINSRRIDKALHIIREKQGQVSLDKLSDTLYISKDYLRHLVKSTTGQSPLRHIISSRMEKAKHLLESTRLTVAEVAAECGFNDVYYFTRFFRRNAKLPPAAYRKAHGQNKPEKCK